MALHLPLCRDFANTYLISLVGDIAYKEISAYLKEVIRERYGESSWLYRTMEKLSTDRAFLAVGAALSGLALILEETVGIFGMPQLWDIPAGLAGIGLYVLMRKRDMKTEHNYNQ